LGTWTDRYIDWFRDLGFLEMSGTPTRAAADVDASAKKPAK
jgi:endo-1,4-beta-xylanase